MVMLASEAEHMTTTITSKRAVVCGNADEITVQSNFCVTNLSFNSTSTGTIRQVIGSRLVCFHFRVSSVFNSNPGVFSTLAWFSGRWERSNCAQSQSGFKWTSVRLQWQSPQLTRSEPHVAWFFFPPYIWASKLSQNGCRNMSCCGYLGWETEGKREEKKKTLDRLNVLYWSLI